MGRHERHAADHGASRGAAQSHRRPETGAPRVLILGGSADGFEAADLFVARGFDVVTSFAGRTETRRAPAGVSRVGGFGGVTGFAAYLAVEDFAFVVDATHPFASVIKATAEKGCGEVGVPFVHVVRPAWTPQDGDDWRVAPDVEHAAAMTPATAGPCFLTVGRMKIAPFAKRRDLAFVVRTVEPPEPPFEHPNTIMVNDRGPFSLKNERVLFEEHGFGCLVTANSGGSSAAPKLVVARERGIPVVVVDRPPPPNGPIVATAAAALEAALQVIDAPAA